MTIHYEWDVEYVASVASPEYEEDDVILHNFCSSFSKAKAISITEVEVGMRYDIVLTRQDDISTSWAYLNSDGTLPEYFVDAYGNDSKKVPLRFHKEVSRFFTQVTT